MNIPFGNHMLVALSDYGMDSDPARHFHLKGTGHKFSIEVHPEGWLVRRGREPDGLLFVGVDWETALLRQVEAELRDQAIQDESDIRELSRRLQVIDEARGSAAGVLERQHLARYRSLMRPIEQVWCSLSGHFLVVCQTEQGDTCTRFRYAGDSFAINAPCKPDMHRTASEYAEDILIELRDHSQVYDSAWCLYQTTKLHFFQMLLPGVRYDLTIGDGENPSEIIFHALNRSVSVEFSESSPTYSVTCYDHSRQMDPPKEYAEVDPDAVGLLIRTLLFGNG